METCVGKIKKNVREYENTKQYKAIVNMLNEFDKMKEDGKEIKIDSEEYEIREYVITSIVRILKNDLRNTRENRPISIMGSIVPKIWANAVVPHRVDVRNQTAGRIACELFIEQFAEKYRWAAHLDHFYSDTKDQLTTDIDKTCIQASIAAAEKRYRGVIKMLQRKYKVCKDSFVDPFDNEQIADDKQYHSSSELEPSSGSDDCGINTLVRSSLNSVSNSMIAPSLRNTRVASAPPTAEPDGERGFGFGRRRGEGVATAAE